jgi:hypothetical protein
MRKPSPARRAVVLRFALALVALPVVSAAIVAGGACDEGPTVGWLCLNPVTGKVDATVGDPNHYTGDVYDPCYCYSPCGPSKECPITVDAGPPPPGTVCDAGPDGDAGDDGP